MIIYLLICGLLMNCISSQYVKQKAETLLTQPYQPLPDIIHNIFPQINVLIPDYFLLICLCLIIYNIDSLVEFNRNLLSLAICTIIRSFSVFFTIMPTCMPKPTTKKNFYTRYFLSTHDLMFSGHSLFFIAIGNMLNNIFISIIGPLLLVISRQHYTIDICGSGLIYYYIWSKI